MALHRDSTLNTALLDHGVQTNLILTYLLFLWLFPSCRVAGMTNDLSSPHRPVRLLARSQSSTFQISLTGVQTNQCPYIEDCSFSFIMSGSLSCPSLIWEPFKWGWGYTDQCTFVLRRSMIQHYLICDRRGWECPISNKKALRKHRNSPL